MSRPPRLLIAEPENFSAAVVDRLREVATVDVRKLAAGDLAQALRDYDVFWFRLGHRIDANVLTSASRCRLIVSPVTGLDHIDEDLCARLGVTILSLRGERSFLKTVRATAELTLGLAIAVMRHVPAASRHTRSGKWVRDEFRGNELYEKRAGIVGCGRLGAIVAGYLRALGMRVRAYDPRPEAEVPAGVERASSLEEVLADSDLVSLHVNYHTGTDKLIAAAEFAACKRGAVLVNTSRGGLIDEPALLEALRSGRLAAAALDVVRDEATYTASNPLAEYARTHDNLLLSPHIGGNTYESFERTEQFLAGKVIDYLKSSAGEGSR